MRQQTESSNDTARRSAPSYNTTNSDWRSYIREESREENVELDATVWRERNTWRRGQPELAWHTSGGIPRVSAHAAQPSALDSRALADESASKRERVPWASA